MIILKVLFVIQIHGVWITSRSCWRETLKTIEKLKTSQTLQTSKRIIIFQFSKLFLQFPEQCTFGWDTLSLRELIVRLIYFAIFIQLLGKYKVFFCLSQLLRWHDKFLESLNWIGNLKSDEIMAMPDNLFLATNCLLNICSFSNREENVLERSGWGDNVL